MSLAILFISGIIIGYNLRYFRSCSLSKTSPPVLENSKKTPIKPATIVSLKSRVEELVEILNKENGK